MLCILPRLRPLIPNKVPQPINHVTSVFTLNQSNFLACHRPNTVSYMARMKQTAWKNTRGKPLAMGRGKDPAPKLKPKPGHSDRKVIIEYSSDEEGPQQEAGAAALKRVVRQIHLTLPTSPSHVTTTESFKTFFINHGFT